MSSSREKFLQEFHQKNPGCTPAAFSNAYISEGSNSYDCLSNLLSTAGAPLRIVDLACGDGTLLKNILDRNELNLELIGIDMSSGELEVARNRLAQYPVTIVEANAQALPLAEASVDFIFCHMALMLMDNIEQVVKEIHRCLKPNGVFSAVVGGKFERSAIYDLFLQLLGQALLEENKKWLSNLGDARTRSEDGLRSLFDEQNFADLEVKELKLQFYERPADLMNFFMLMYDVGLLSEQRKAKLFTDLLQALNSMCDESGRIKHFMWVRQVTCVRPISRMFT